MAASRAPRLARRTRALRCATPAALALSIALLPPPGPIPLKDVEVRGAVNAPRRELRGTIRTAVHIPFGKVHVTGRVRAGYDCDANYAGTVSYGRLVRFFARLKDVTLVTVLDGRVEAGAAAWDCAVSGEPFEGRFTVEDSSLTGYLRSAGDSLDFCGTIRTVGDTTYHGMVETTRRGEPYAVHFNFYKR